MKPTLSDPKVRTTYGAAPPIGLPFFTSMTFDTTNCHLASPIH